MFAAFLVSNLGQWVKSKLYTLLFLAILFGFGFYIYSGWKAKSALIEEQGQTIKDQGDNIKSLIEEQKKLNESSKATAEAISELSASTREVDNRAKARNADTVKKIKDIAGSNLTAEEKETNTSLVYALSLHKNYCAIKPESCENDIYKKPN